MINTTSSVTELGDFSEKELTDEELLSQIKVGHLTLEQQNDVLNLYKEFISCFPRTEYDIPINSVSVFETVDLKPDFNFNWTLYQKFHPAHPKARDQVQLVLDKLKKHGIIDDCPEYAPIVSNLVIQKKKNNNCR